MNAADSLLIAVLLLLFIGGVIWSTQKKSGCRGCKNCVWGSLCGKKEK